MYTDANADYPFRANVLREDVARFLVHRLEEMTYDNFKNTIDDDRYHDAALDVWRTMYRYGEDYRGDAE